MRLAVLFLVLTGCTADPVLPALPGLPCGKRGQVCPNHMCCLDTEDCGGTLPGCPEGMCCANGSNVLATRWALFRPQYAPATGCR